MRSFLLEKAILLIFMVEIGCSKRGNFMTVMLCVHTGGTTGSAGRIVGALPLLK